MKINKKFYEVSTVETRGLATDEDSVYIHKHFKWVIPEDEMLKELGYSEIMTPKFLSSELTGDELAFDNEMLMMEVDDFSEETDKWIGSQFQKLKKKFGVCQILYEFDHPEIPKCENMVPESSSEVIISDKFSEFMADFELLQATIQRVIEQKKIEWNER